MELWSPCSKLSVAQNYGRTFYWQTYISAIVFYLKNKKNREKWLKFLYIYVFIHHDRFFLPKHLVNFKYVNNNMI